MSGNKGLIALGVIISSLIILIFVGWMDEGGGYNELSESGQIALFIGWIIYGILAYLAVPHTIRKGKEKLSYRPRMFIAVFTGVLIIPWWIFNILTGKNK